MFSMILAGISLAVSVIPEGLPAVISITLAFEIKRMQTYNALVKKTPCCRNFRKSYGNLHRQNRNTN